MLMFDTFTQTDANHPRAKSPACSRPGRRFLSLLLGCLGLLVLALQHTSPVQAAPPGGPAGWTQTFGDEFNSSQAGSSVDTNIWVPNPVYVDGNGNLQGVEWNRPSNFLPVVYYRAKNVTEDGSGNLALSTYREDYNPNSSNYYAYGLQHYTSAWMVTRDFQQSYGYFEVRMKAASTPGLDTAFWLLQNGTSDPEVDIVENPSGNRVYDNGQFTGGGYAVSQGYIPGGGNSNVGQLTTSGTSYAADYHIYGLDWEPGSMTWYIDGVPTLHTSANVPTQALHMLLSAEMERDTDQIDPNSYSYDPSTQTYTGTRDGNPNGAFFGDPDQGAYPATTLVDWVHVWQKLPEAAYNGPHNLPGTVKATDYDTGGQGVAYNQLASSGGTATGYRPDNSGADGGPGLGWTAAGQWYKYTVAVATTGSYSFSFDIGSPSGGRFHIEDENGNNLTGSVSVPGTGNYSTHGTATAVQTATLSAGPHVLKWVQDTGGYDIFSMTVSSASGGTGAVITGTEFDDGAGPYGGNTANAAPAAFDGNVNTFYDCTNISGYVGLDAGVATTVSSIVFAPRPGYEGRMNGGVFEGSNTSATSGYTTLATVTATPSDGLTNTLPVANSTAYRWLRYRDSGTGNCNVAEIQFVDPPAGAPALPTGLKATAGATGTKKIGLAWSAAPGATSYHILRSLASGYTGTKALAVNVNSTGYTDSGLTAGTTYYYEVTAVNAHGGSGSSVQASAKAQ